MMRLTGARGGNYAKFGDAPRAQLGPGTVLFPPRLSARVSRTMYVVLACSRVAGHSGPAWFLADLLTVPKWFCLWDARTTVPGTRSVLTVRGATVASGLHASRCHVLYVSVAVHACARGCAVSV